MEQFKLIGNKNGCNSSSIGINYVLHEWNKVFDYLPYQVYGGMGKADEIKTELAFAKVI